MQPEEIAQRFSRRKDYEIVDFSPVALPMYAITIECICSVHRPFPPIALFILRAVRTGLERGPDIAKFLGLDVSTVRITLQELVEARYVSEDADPERYTVTDLGLKIIEAEKEFVPQEETYTVIFDGILRRPVWMSGERLLRPSEIDRLTTIEIRPYPAALPELEDLKLADVVAVLRSQYDGANEFDRDVLALSKISRRSTVFRMALGLAYKMKKGPEIQIALIVDGVPHNELEQIFAEKGGARKMGFIKALSEEGIEKKIRRHLGNNVVRLLPEDTELHSKKQILASARFDLEIAANRIEAEPAAVNAARLEEARSRYEQAVRAIQEFQARSLDVYELNGLLDDAIVSAGQRVYFAVTEFWETSITREFIRQVESALNRGVQIRILEFVRGDNQVPKAIAGRLADFAKLERYKNLSVTRSARRGFFFLVKDAQFAAIANRPLFGPASKTRMFHQFAGYLLQAPDLVNAYVSRLMDVYWGGRAAPH